MGTLRPIDSGRRGKDGRIIKVSGNDNAGNSVKLNNNDKNFKQDFSGNTIRFDLSEYYEQFDAYDSVEVSDIDNIARNIPDVNINVVTSGDKDNAVIVMRGLPGSGKSTIANEWQEMFDNRAIISRDTFRKALYNSEGVLTMQQEKVITDMVNSAITSNLKNGNSVVIDQTSLRRADTREFGKLAIDNDSDFVIVNVDVNVDEAKKRAAKRISEGGRSVPPEVISNMHDKFGYLRKQAPITLQDIQPKKSEFAPYECKSGIETPTVLFDIDGTLAKMKKGEGERTPYDWDRVDEDDPNNPVIQQLKINRAAGNSIVIMSGRDEQSRAKTEAWLEKHGIEYDDLFMRPEGDQRRDDKVKRELLENVENNYGPVIGAYDDRDQVVDAYRSIGITVFQVDYGNF